MIRQRCFTLLMIIGFAIVAHAHHSPNSLYILEETIVIEGTVTRYQFINPHARIFLDVVNSTGKTEQWLAEGGSPNVLVRVGWDGNEVKKGDFVTITGNPPRNGTNVIHWVDILLPDGREIYGEDIDFRDIDRRRRRSE